MKFLYVLCISLLFLNCNAPAKSVEPIIGTEDSNDSVTISTEEDNVIIEPSIPIGVAVGDFNGNLKSFYAEISSVDLVNETTTISFENNRFPPIQIPKTVGGKLSAEKPLGFDKDILVLTAKLKDPNFNKYFLFVLKNNQWKPIVNGFAIHKSNLSGELTPFQTNPSNPNEILRHYSVFDLDSDSPYGYTWRLLQESIPILNK